MLLLFHSQFFLSFILGSVVCTLLLTTFYFIIMSGITCLGTKEKNNKTKQNVDIFIEKC